MARQADVVLNCVGPYLLYGGDEVVQVLPPVNQINRKQYSIALYFYHRHVSKRERIIWTFLESLRYWWYRINTGAMKS